jgi:hypothetical protein
MSNPAKITYKAIRIGGIPTTLSKMPGGDQWLQIGQHSTMKEAMNEISRLREQEESNAVIEQIG